MDSFELLTRKAAAFDYITVNHCRSHSVYMDGTCVPSLHGTLPKSRGLLDAIEIRMADPEYQSRPAVR